MSGFNPDPIMDSVDPLTEMILAHSYLTVDQSARLARVLLGLVGEADED